MFDFIQFHVGAWSWYVFNVADAAIVAGVVGLLYDSFVLERRRAELTMSYGACCHMFARMSDQAFRPQWEIERWVP